MRSSHNKNKARTMQIVNTVIDAADACDPVALNDFFRIAIEANLSHLELINETLTPVESMKRQNALLAGSILLGLFNHFSTRKLRDGLGVHEINPG
jgi:hypothetical protein